MRLDARRCTGTRSAKGARRSPFLFALVWTGLRPQRAKGFCVAPDPASAGRGPHPKHPRTGRASPAPPPNALAVPPRRARDAGGSIPSPGSPACSGKAFPRTGRPTASIATATCGSSDCCSATFPGRTPPRPVVARRLPPGKAAIRDTAAPVVPRTDAVPSSGNGRSANSSPNRRRPIAGPPIRRQSASRSPPAPTAGAIPHRERPPPDAETLPASHCGTGKGSRENPSRAICATDFPPGVVRRPHR